MTMSIRNQLPGTITAIIPGEVMATVIVRLSGGQPLTAAITREAVSELGLATGCTVRALVKSTDVSLVTGTVEGLSIRNQLQGTVGDITVGAAMASVKVSVDNGALTAVITADAASDLALTPGASVVALIKSTDVALATP
ncbi:molybdopterin-binding protein [Streptomyces griseus]|uniref:TOBE domain-containing protein n=1 Tax=Streptomyces griseus TaxID=1911 RepID=UPI00055E2F65|nr:TOBE domain-containing protein [Streptomyces griseus]